MNKALLQKTRLALAIVSAFTAPFASAATTTFNTAGTASWVCPAGVTSVQVECWGGGGAGGLGTGIATGTSQNGGGGGGGAYARKVAVPVTPGNSYTITIPAAAVSGSGGQTANAQFVSGGAVTFVGDSSTTVTAAGGAGGRNVVVTTNSTAQGAGGAGGVTTTPSVGDAGGVFAGGGGAAGTLGSAGSPAGDNSSGAGGGGGGNTAAGSAAVAGTGTGSTIGAGGILGGGAGGAGRIGANTNAGVGGAGVSPGGGGGGAKNVGASTFLGGTGGLGRISISYPTTVVKANNATALNATGSWTGGVVPGFVDIAKWDNTVAAANTTLLGANTTWGGIQIVNPGGLVTISSGNTLNLGAATTDIDLSSATRDLTMNCSIVMGAANVWDVTSGRTLTLGGAVSGSQTVSKQGLGTATLSGSNSYTGTTTVNGGRLQIITGTSTTGAGQYTVGSAATSKGILLIGTGANVTTTDMDFGSNATGAGAAYQSAGAVALTATDASGVFGLGNATGGYGYYEMSGGTLSANRLTLVNTGLTSGTGIFRQTAGTTTVSTWIIPTHGAGNALLDISGGALNHTAAANFGMNSVANGYAVFNVRGAGTFDTNSPILVLRGSSATATGTVGILNLLTGGTINTAVGGITNGTTSGGSGVMLVNLNGGTLFTKVASTTLISLNNTNSVLATGSGAYMHSGGLTVDTNSVNSTIPASLLAPSGEGVSTIAVTSQGSGYIGAPFIKITGGSGVGATAVANMVDDGTGNGTYKIGSITVTNPGSGYANTDTLTLAFGDNASVYTTQAVLGAVNFNGGNTSGNLTKIGGGILTLSGTNTFTGDTAINVGTITLSGSGTLASTNITIASASGFDVSAPTTALTLGSGQTLKASATGANTTGTITVASTKNLTLSAGGLAFTALGSSNTTAPLTVTGASAGALALNGAPVTVNTTAVLAAGNYKLIAKGGSASGVTGSPGALSVTGLGIAGGGLVATLQVVSGELFLNVGVPDTTPPTLVSANIIDDRSGAPIAPNALVTYMVTFSEDMDASTVTDVDFGNAGTATLTIGAVTEISPGVFSVPVTPTTTGTLQFQLLATAVVNDVAGNALAAPPVTDDTTLTVENTPPTLASTDIVDDKGGNTVFQNTLVTYTVTFSEDMNAATVTAADFGNAGSATVTLGTVTEISPGVFSMPVTPTTTGTLQLQLLATAVVNDVAGNALAAPPVTDDTTLTVVGLLAYWDTDDTTPGSGSTDTPTGTWLSSNSLWNSVADGSGSTIAWVPGQTAIFAAGANATGVYDVTVSGTNDIGGLTFEEGTVRLTGGTALRLVANTAADVATGLTAIIETPITQDASARTLTKSGLGSLTLNASNSYAGATTISGGALRLANTGALGTSPSVAIGAFNLQLGTDTAFAQGSGTSISITGGTIVSDRATAGDGLTHAFAGNLSASHATHNFTAGTNVTNSGTAAIQFASMTCASGSGGNLTFNPTTANLIITGNATGANTGTSGFILGGTSTGNSIGGVIANGTRTTQNVTKSGTSTWTLSGLSATAASNYNGATTIDQGILAFTTTNPSLSGGIIFGASAGSTNVGSLDLSNASATFGGGMIVRTDSASSNAINIGAGQTLTFTGSTVANAISVGSATAGGLAKLQVTGSTGTLTVNDSTRNIVVANTDTATTPGGASAQMDLSGLGAFNATIASLYVGRPTSAAGAAANGRPLDSLTLAGANTITASGVIAVGGSTQSFVGSGTLKLGTTNTLNAASFVLGSSRTNGTMQFNTGLTTPAVTIRGATGGSSLTNIYLGDQANSQGVSNGAGGSSTILGKMDFTGGSVDAKIGSLFVGLGGGVSSNLRANGQGTFIIDGASSNVDVNTLVIAQNRNDNTASTTNPAGIGCTAIFTMINGTLVVNTAATLANDIDTTNTANSQQGLSATFNVQGGTATIGSLSTPLPLILGTQVAAGNAGTLTATVNLAGGTLNMFGDIKEGTLGNGTITSSLTLDGATLDMKGYSIGVGFIDTLTFSSGTLKNVAQINGGAALTKGSSGTLTLSGTNSYTGATTINDGTLALGASDVLPNSSAVSIGSATLDALTYTDTAGALDVSGAAVINLGSGGALAFANSDMVDWAGGTLSITGTFVSGSSLRFGTTSSGLTSTQLSQISISGYGSMGLSSTGYLTAIPTFSGVTASQTISYGTATVTLSGTVSATGPVYPANGETVAVTINGVTQNATIAGGTGGFSVDFNTATIPVSVSPYTITYAYAGNGTTLLAAADHNSTALTVITPYQAWLLANGKTDSSANLREYSFGTTSTSSLVLNPDGTIQIRGQAPIIQTTLGSPVVTLTYARLKNSGCTFSAEFTTDLTTWLQSNDPNLIYPPGAPAESVTDNGDDMEVVRVKFPIFLKQGDGSYLKMEQNFSRITVTTL